MGTANGNIDITLNSESYSLEVSIIRIVDNGSMHGTATLKYWQPILNRVITSIQIINDIKYPILVGSISIQDPGGYILHKIKSDGYTFITIKLKKISTTNASIVEHTFIIEDVEILDKESKFYKLHISSEYWYNFNNYLNYTSSDIAPYTESLFELLSRSGIPLSNIYTNTDAEGFYITPTNSSVIESMDDLLHYSISIDNSFNFVLYNMTDNEFEIFNTLNLFKNHKDNILLDNYLLLPTKEYVGEQRRTFNSIKNQSYIPFPNIINNIKPIAKNLYDYDERKWTRREYTNENIFNLFPKADPDEIKFSPIPKFNKDANIIKPVRDVLDNDFNHNWYNDIVDTFLYSNTILGSTLGVLDRSPGQLLEIVVDKESELYNKFNGIWFMYRVIHEIQPAQQNYTNTIYASRAGQHKELDSNVGSR